MNAKTEDNHAKKTKQEKPSVQSAEEQRREKTVEDTAHHGGRSKWPDEDVNPAEDLQIQEGEEGRPAKTSDHHAQRRDDKDDDK